MSTTTDLSSYIFNTDIGNVVVQFKEIVNFDVEDIIRQRAISQARAIQLLNIGKQIDINRPTAARTLPTVYLKNTEELPE